MNNKTTMPYPMVEVDKHAVSSELQYTYFAPFDGLEHGTELITTTQAEAYADARVREALEEAAQEVELTHSNSDDQDRFQIRAAEAIRALIPKENKT